MNWLSRRIDYFCPPMKKFVFILMFSSLMASSAYAQDMAEVPVMNFDELDTYLKSQEEEILVVNFWATWCIPCVEELPYFESAHQEFKDQDVKVILVSLDFKKALDSQLIPFLNRKGIESEVILLSDPKMNTWIDRVNTDWSGAIPATWYIAGDSSIFNEGKYSNYQSLKNTISILQKL